MFIGVLQRFKMSGCEKVIDLCVGVTEVDARWLASVAEPLVELSAPLNPPALHYSSAADAVVATHAGIHLSCTCLEVLIRVCIWNGCQLLTVPIQPTLSPSQLRNPPP